MFRSTSRALTGSSGNVEYAVRLVYFACVIWMTTRLGNVTAVANDESYCFARDTNPYRNFGTSTPYNYVSGASPQMKIPTDNVCKPVYVYGLMRVGTRYYTQYNAENLKSLQQQILKNHEATNKRGELCPDDLTLLKSWSSQGAGKTSSDIAPQGKIVSAELGSRLYKTLKEVGDVNSSNFDFLINTDKTSGDSATAFAKGMFGSSTKVKLSSNEDKLRFIENTKILDEKLTKRAFAIRDTCVNSKPMKTLAKEVSDRLGFTSTLPDSSIEDMYFSCIFETAWTPDQKSGFCAAFTKRHLQLMEYCYMDILGYYEWGYGALYALKMQNPILNDFLSRMNTVIQSKDTSSLKGDFNFGSAAALTHTIMKLGLYRDEKPLLSSNYYGSKTQERKWSMTRISPFNGNLIAVLHKCGAIDYKVSLYHNESPITLPGCSSALCPWSQFQNIIRSSNKQSSKPLRANRNKQLKQSMQVLKQAKTVRLGGRAKAQ